MKIIVIGDSHGNVANLKHVMGFAKKVNAGAVIHTGDWDNLKSVETVLEYKIPLYAVLGNADISDDLRFKIQDLGIGHFNEDYLELEIDNLKIGVVHKFINPKSSIMNPEVLFTGHYHSQKIWEQNKVKIVRPGALENGINFAIFDTQTKGVEFIYG